MKKEMTREGMLLRMAGLCAGAEHCSADIRAKILRKGFSAEDADGMITYLQKNKYLDDSRYARAYATDKVRFSGWGRQKVRMGLRGKGLSDSEISQALEYIKEEDYRESIQKVMAAKARSLDLADVKDRQKLYRHMASRGFESQFIITVMREVMKNKEEG